MAQLQLIDALNAASEALGLLIALSHAALQPTTQQLLAQLLKLAQHAWRTELYASNEVKPSEIASGLQEAQIKHFLIDLGHWYAIPGSIQRFIAG